MNPKIGKMIDQAMDMLKATATPQDQWQHTDIDQVMKDIKSGNYNPSTYNVPTVQPTPNRDIL